MSKRADHRIMISQQFDGVDHYTPIRLRERTVEGEDENNFTSGIWKHTDESYNGEEIKFTSDHPKYLYWEWKSTDPGGSLNIGTKMGRASHKTGEEGQVFDTL